jgi:hypothetical protein
MGKKDATHIFVTKAQKGESEAFDTLVEEYRRRVLRWASL